MVLPIDYVNVFLSFSLPCTGTNIFCILQIIIDRHHNVYFFCYL